MKKFISLILIGLAMLYLGCISEKVEKQTTPTLTPTTPTPTKTVVEEEINVTINTTEIDTLLNYLQEIESINFS